MGTIMESIRARRSVRTFDGKALEPAVLEQLQSFIQKIEDPYEIPVEFKLLPAAQYGLSSPVISGTDLYYGAKIRKMEHAEEAFGYAFELLILYAWSLGIGTTWIGGTMNRDAFEKAMKLQADEWMPCITPIGRPAAKMSLRETLMRKGVKADSRLPFASLFFAGSFAAPLMENAAGRLQVPLEAVRLAPSAVNKQPWRVVIDGDRVHFYEKRSKGFGSGDGYDLQKVDLGIALCHFALAAQENGLSLRFILEDPGIRTDADTSYIATYQIME